MVTGNRRPTATQHVITSFFMGLLGFTLTDVFGIAFTEYITRGRWQRFHKFGKKSSFPSRGSNSAGLFTERQLPTFRVDLDHVPFAELPGENFQGKRIEK